MLLFGFLEALNIVTPTGTSGRPVRLTRFERARVSEALKLLDPEQPTEPHKLLSSEGLEDVLDVADIMDGRLPDWQDRGQVQDEIQGEIQSPDHIAEAGEGETPFKVSELTISGLQFIDNEDKTGADQGNRDA